MSKTEAESHATQTIDAIIQAIEIPEFADHFASLGVHEKWDQFCTFVERVDLLEDDPEQTREHLLFRLVKVETLCKIASLMSVCASSTHLLPIPDDPVVNSDCQRSLPMKCY